MKKIILALGTLFFVLFKTVHCQPSFFESASGMDNIPEPDKIMGKIIDHAAEEISKKYQFMPIGFGLSGKFEGVGLSFRVYHLLEKAQARCILFDCAEILLRQINSSKEIRPYLKFYPFTIEHIGITIYSTDENYTPFSHPYPAVACIGNGEVIFRTKDKDQEFGYKEVTKETIEEARAILNKTSAQ